MKKVLLSLGLLLIIVLAFVIPKYIRDLRAAQKKASVYRAMAVTLADTSIEYLRSGNGQPILVSHGITGGFDQGLGLSRLYIGGQYDIIAVSRFGYLGSTFPKDSSPEAQADAHKRLLDELKVDKTFVFGNSAGGTSAIKFAMKYPERCKGLILVSSVVPLKTQPKMAPKPLMKVIFGNNFIYWSFVKLMNENMLKMAGVPEPILKDLSKQKKAALMGEIILGGFPINQRTKGVINDMYLSNPDINHNYAFEQIKVPVLIISAKDDPLCLYEGAFTLKEAIPNAKLVSYETGGHLILGHEKEIQKEISEFIKSNQ